MAKQKYDENGEPIKKKGKGKKIVIAIIVIIIIIIIAGNGGNNEEEKVNEDIAKSSESSEIEENAEASSDTSKSEESASASNEQTSSENESSEADIPVEYKNALKKAKTYIELMHMSKEGVYNQLTSEYGDKFPAEAAEYAVTELDKVVDWNKVALKKAETYYKDMSMSKDKIFDQLTSEYGEKFTQEQAQYAIDHLEQ